MRLTSILRSAPKLNGCCFLSALAHACRKAAVYFELNLQHRRAEVWNYEHVARGLGYVSDYDSDDDYL